MRRGVPWLLLVAGILLLFFNWDDLRLKLTSPPISVEPFLASGAPRTVVYLFGGDQCTTCRAKTVIGSLKNEEEVVFVFEEEVSDGEIENFMGTFQVIGTPVRGSSAVERYLKRLAATLPTKQWRHNYLVTYGQQRLVTFTPF